MEVKVNSNEDLSLNKTQALHNMVLAVRYIFHESNKY